MRDSLRFWRTHGGRNWLTWRRDIVRWRLRDWLGINRMDDTLAAERRASWAMSGTLVRLEHRVRALEANDAPS